MRLARQFGSVHLDSPDADLLRKSELLVCENVELANRNAHPRAPSHVPETAVPRRGADQCAVTMKSGGGTVNRDRLTNNAAVARFPIPTWGHLGSAHNPREERVKDDTAFPTTIPGDFF